MAGKPEPKATIMLVVENYVSQITQVRPYLSCYFEFFRSKGLMDEKIPERVEFRPDNHTYTIWIDDQFVAFTDVMPFNDVYQVAGSFEKSSPVKLKTVNRLASLLTALDNLVKSCTDDKGVPTTPTQEAVDQAKSLLIQYQTNKLSGE